MSRIRTFEQLGVDAVDLAGGKGANLGELTRAGLPVPPGFVITTDVYARFVGDTGINERIVEFARTVGADDFGAAEAAATAIAGLFAQVSLPQDLTDAIAQAYAELGAGPVAVRSSATAEDLGEASFAGQQDTFLDVCGTDDVLTAVVHCWASLWTPRALAYRQRVAIPPDEVSIAVVVQQLVDAESAGVLFTANPTNGRRDETVISAAWGLGEAVVGGEVTPDTVVLRSTPHGIRVASTEVADKQVRTVRTGAGTTTEPVPAADRHRPVLTGDQAIDLAGLGARIRDHYDRPMDIEWARTTAGRFAILQARPITALPDPVGPAPTDWPVVDPTSMYARASIVEQMPDPLTPLFADMIIPAVSTSVVEVFDELVGEGAVTTDDLSFVTVNGYAYYGYTRRGILKMMVRAAPHIAKAFSGRGMVERWREERLPRYRGLVAAWRDRDLGTLSCLGLLDAVAELLLAGCRYYTSVQTVIPAAASSETAFTRVYEPIRRRRGGPPASTFVLGYDSEPLRADRALYDLGRWVAGEPELARVLADTTRPAASLVQDERPPDGVPAEVWQEWRRRIRAHLDAYGHAISNLDFVDPVAADQPDPVLAALRFYLGDGHEPGPDPRARAERLAREREAATAELLSSLDPARRRLIGRMLRRAQRLAPVREDALAEVGLAWPLIRRLLRALGERLVAAGALTEPDEVFWLTEKEARAEAGRVDAGAQPYARHAEAIAERRATWRGRRTVTPPGLLPRTGVNALWQRFMPSNESAQHGPVLRGLGASGGRVAGEAAVITDPADFATMQPGRILVATITTPAYTPLFAMAGGVVTDVGGPLSHSSIVAREYGIPAVLGTGVATRRIATGDHLTVDGTAGTVLLEEPAGRTVPWLVFDGDCGFCTTTATWLAHRLARQDGTDAHLTPWQRTDLAALGTTRERARSEVLWVATDGRVAGGAEAFARWLVHRGGGYGALGGLLLLPGLRTIAAAVYRLIARNRHRLPGGTPACALPRDPDQPG